jgi:hypothetical protein
LLFPVHNDSRGLTKSTYDELLTSKLLALAIALRTKFYQGTPYKGTDKYLDHVINYEQDGKLPGEINFTIKDACDKIIHADSIVRQFKNEQQKPLTILTGVAQGGVKWTLSFSLAHLADSILWWLEDVENT